MKHLSILILILTCFPPAFLIAQRKATKPADPVRPVLLPEPVKKISPSDGELHARTVQYANKDVIKIRTKLRYTTLIVLPRNEQILDFTCGDKEFWVIDGNQNFAHVKPAKAAAQTNLNLVTASGNVYSFILAEVSEAVGDHDLKVFVESKDESILSAAAGPPKFVSSQVLDDYRHQIELAKQETQQVKAAGDAAMDRVISDFVSRLRFPYRFEAGKKPFSIRAMYNDGRFTYIHAQPEEAPALYEIKDGRPNVVNFRYEKGVYVVEKVLDRGYLAIGKEKVTFTRGN